MTLPPQAPSGFASAPAPVRTASIPAAILPPNDKIPALVILSIVVVLFGLFLYPALGFLAVILAASGYAEARTYGGRGKRLAIYVMAFGAFEAFLCCVGVVTGQL
jgi:hypothetical protein